MSGLAPRPLGRTGLDVSALGFGAAPLGDLYARLDDRAALATVEAALAGGITLVDTAPLYGHGLSEHRCGTALRRAGRAGIVVSTKVGRVMHPGRGSDGSGYVGGLPHRAAFDYSRDGTLRSVEQSLLRLGLDAVDVLLIHDVDGWTHGADVEARFREAMAGAYRALDELRAGGTVRAIGIGVNEVGMCLRFAEAGDFDVMLLAGRYSLLEQPALDAFLPLAERRGIGVMLGGVYNSGILATGAREGARYDYAPAPPAVLARVARIERVCAAHGVSLREAALRFAMAHPAVASVVLGAVSPDEVAANLAGAAAPIPAGLWSDLVAEGLLSAHAPVPAGL